MRRGRAWDDEEEPEEGTSECTIAQDVENVYTPICPPQLLVKLGPIFSCKEEEATYALHSHSISFISDTPRSVSPISVSPDRPVSLGR